MDIRTQVGLNVQRIRRARGWSQEELAFQSGLHRTYISGIERGARKPDRHRAEGTRDALGVPPGDLLNGAPAP